MSSLPVRLGVAAVVTLLLAWLYLSLAATPADLPLARSLLVGMALGVVLQRARFCFFCHWRDLIDQGDGRGTVAILLALAVGVVGYTVVVGAWLPDPTTGRLPPDAHIGPVSWALIVAAAAFGLGMVISGSCISAHFYRLGEGSPTAPFALVGAGIGFLLGFRTWNPLYLETIATAEVVWLPRYLGHGGALGLALLVLLSLILLLWRRQPATAPAVSPWRALFVDRWPAWWGGLAVGGIGTAAYLRVEPLGVTSELGGRARQLGDVFGLVPARLEGLDQFRGCATAITEALLSSNGALVLGLVGAAFAAALVAGQFQPRLPTFRDAARGLTGGVLLGWGAMTGLGCTVGTLMSGIMAGAASGWVFLVVCFATVALGLRVQRLINPVARAGASG
ncbi:MAG: YeeE/YedE family protein [Geminicoccaceae bacterium]|nr:MAG: YeeE/YedE family protein [Geminicoccaceae bacterium]